ncbi:MAG TPA: DUF4349 domain-containing protein [Pyrinomonadaceae bacterium]
MLKINLIAVFLFALVSFGCAASEKAVQISDSNAASAAPATEPGVYGKTSQTQKISLEQTANAQNVPAVTERKVIRNANLTLETNAPEEAGRKIAAIAESKGGFVVNSEAKTSGADDSTRTSVTVTVRVPASQFDTTVAEIRQTAERVSQEKVSGQDVTEEFIDLEARIRTQKALEAQFLEIMKGARSVADALEVQKQLAEVRGEIEKVEGRRKFLENQTSFSTITVTLNTPTVFAAASTGFGAQLWRALGDGVDAALFVVLGLIRVFLAMLPLLILFGIPIWLIVRHFRKKWRLARLAQQIEQEEKS